MLRSVRTLLGSAAGLAHTRLELLGADLRVERARLAAAVIGSLARQALGCRPGGQAQ